MSVFIELFEKDNSRDENTRNFEVSRIMKIYGKENSTGNAITFEEFVKYIVDTHLSNTAHMDENWETIARLCQPCLAR